MKVTTAQLMIQYGGRIVHKVLVKGVHTNMNKTNDT